MIKRLTTFLLTILVISSAMAAAINTAAAQRKSVSFSFASYSYSSDTKAMTPQTEFAPEETAYISVNLSEISGIGGFGLRLNYDADALTFDKSRIVYYITDEKSEYLLNDKSGSLILTWETTATDTVLSGNVMYLPFTVNGHVTDGTTVNFTASISEAFEGNKAQTTINTSITAVPSITIKSATVDEEFLTLVESLKTLKYNPSNKEEDSLADINKALEMYAALSVKEQNSFYKNHKELYDTLTNALNEYYKLAEKEASRLANEEAQKFLKDNNAILSKQTADLTLSDSAAVESMNSGYKLLSDAAKILVSDTVKQKMAEINDKMESLEEEAAIAAEIAEYKAAYDMFLSDKNYPSILDSWEYSYDTYYAYISEADLMYGLLSGKAQESLAVYKERIDKLNSLYTQYVGDAEQAAKITEAVNQFQSTYIDVFGLNANNVEINDETAIKMVVSAYEKLEDEAVKKALETRINNLKKLLDVIAELENEADNSTAGGTTGTASGTTSTGNTSSGTKTETVTNTVTKIINKLQGTTSNFRAAFLILLVFLMLSVCGLIAAVFISQKQHINELTQGGDTDEIE